MSDDHPAIVLPASIAPGAAPDGYLMHGYALDDGRLLVVLALTDANATGVDLPRSDGLLVAIYDGDDGRLMQVSVVRPEGPHGAVIPLLADMAESPSPVAAMFGDAITERLRGIAKEVAVQRLEESLDECTGDPDQPCPLCDDSVAEGEMIDRLKTHRECQLARQIGWYGHLIDCDFWCGNMRDPMGGLSVRESALRVAALVEQHGIIAVVDGTFKQDEKAP